MTYCFKKRIFLYSIVKILHSPSIITFVRKILKKSSLHRNYLRTKGISKNLVFQAFISHVIFIVIRKKHNFIHLEIIALIWAIKSCKWYRSTHHAQTKVSTLVFIGQTVGLYPQLKGCIFFYFPPATAIQSTYVSLSISRAPKLSADMIEGDSSV